METEMHFQEEIIMDILTRLPVMSLIRFKSVSKSWNTLISQPSFKKKHSSHSKNDTTNLLIERCTKDGKCSFYSSSLLVKTTSSHQIVQGVHESLRVQGMYQIFCYCDGLFLIGIVAAVEENVIFLLWNPSTRESVQLPPNLDEFFDNSVYGLAYDPTSDDYQVFKVPEEDEEEEAHIEILSLKTGSRRKIDGGHDSVKSYSKDYLAFIQGTFHWLTYVGYPGLSMISFNISNEAFGELSLPEEMRFKHDLMDQGITVLGGMLCVNCINIKENTTVFDLWVMKEYGVKESWTKLFTMRDAKRPQDIIPIIPKYIFADAEVLLSTDGRTVLRTFKESDGRSNILGPLVSHEDDTSMWDGWGYTESWISPKDCVLA